MSEHIGRFASMSTDAAASPFVRHAVERTPEVVGRRVTSEVRDAVGVEAGPLLHLIAEARHLGAGLEHRSPRRVVGAIHGVFERVRFFLHGREARARTLEAFLVDDARRGEGRGRRLSCRLELTFHVTQLRLVETHLVDDHLGELAELLEHMRSTNGALLAGMRSNPKADVPSELGELIASFKADFVASMSSGATADPTATDAEALGEAHSSKTLATE